VPGLYIDTAKFGSPSADSITVGVLIPLTEANGNRNDRSIQNWNAIKLATDEINSRIGTRKLVLETCDTAADTSRVKAQTTWLATSRKSPASLIYRSDPVIEAREIAVSNGMLIMSPSATARDITQLADVPQSGGVGLVWRTAPSDELQARVIAELLKGNNLNFAGSLDAGFGSITKVAIAYSNNSYGQGLNQTVQARLSPAREVRTFVFLEGDDATVASAVASVNAFDPDVTVIISQIDDARRFLNAASTTTNLTRAAGHQWFFTDSNKAPSLLMGLTYPTEIDRALGTAPAQNAGSGYQQFKDRFTGLFGTDPVQFSFTSHSYDAMYVVGLGIAYANGTGDKSVSGVRIAQGLTRLSAMNGQRYDFQPNDFTGAAAALLADAGVNVSGASGELDFNSVTGEAPSGFEIWQVNGTVLQSLGNVDPPP
ncbi:MAG: ABC transporter substrate-binding protein, partial [Myxococcaceae bacterium]